MNLSLESPGNKPQNADHEEQIAPLRATRRKLPSAPLWAFHEPAVCNAIAELLGTSRPDYLLFTAAIWRAPEDQEAKKEGRHFVRASHELINECRGLGRTVGGSGKWLADYCAHVGTTYTEHKVPNNGPGKVRRIDVSFLVGRIPRRLRADARETFVHIVGRRPITAYAVPERIPFASEAQRTIARYIESQAEAIYRIDPEAFAAALAHCRDRTDENLLQGCALTRPLYEAAASGHTERVDDPYWSSVRKTIRRALKPNWVELDLTAAHFCIFERVCRDHKIEAPQLGALLERAGDTWANACCACGVDVRHRDALKELIIKALYGMGRTNLRDNLGEVPSSVLTAPLLREVSRAKTDLAKHARQRGFLRGVGGRKNWLKGSELSLIHSVCSDYEMQLILPVYEVASEQRETGCYVALHQHDGVAVGVGGPEGHLRSFIERCQAAVAARAEAIGVRTALVAKTPLPGTRALSPDAETEAA